MTAKDYPAILFDFDGTLAHSLGQWLDAYRLALEFFGVKVNDDEVKAKCFYTEWDTIVERFNLPSATELEAQVWKQLTEASSKVELFPGVHTMLNNLTERGYKLAIVTSSSGAVVKEILDRVGAHSYFDYVVSANEVKNLKPDPEPILLALDQLQVTARNSVFIGDSHVDMLAGKNAGVRTGLFLPELHKRFYCFDSLKAHDPAFIFSHYDELSDHLFDHTSTPQMKVL